MAYWEISFLVVSVIIFIMSFLPILDHKHWIFRVFDYLRLHLITLAIIALVSGMLIFNSSSSSLTIAYILLVITLIYHVIIIFPFIKFHSNIEGNQEDSISILSVNVLQKNKNYQKLIDIIQEVDPDILLTLETNSRWEKALSEIESNFSFTHFLPKENRYGMHFYTKLDVIECKDHSLISDEHPSIEVLMKDKLGHSFLFWGIHPPPPSPTEKPTAKQKDAELMKVASLVRLRKEPTLVAGDFNTVSWSRTSKLFSKVSTLRDSRRRKGIYGTFPVYFPFLRFPVDHLFHSVGISVSKFKTLRDFGSDHFPLYGEFTVRPENAETGDILKGKLKATVKETIIEGKIAAKEENN